MFPGTTVHVFRSTAHRSHAAQKPDSKRSSICTGQRVRLGHGSGCVSDDRNPLIISYFQPFRLGSGPSRMRCARSATRLGWPAMASRPLEARPLAPAARVRTPLRPLHGVDRQLQARSPRRPGLAPQWPPLGRGGVVDVPDGELGCHPRADALIRRIRPASTGVSLSETPTRPSGRAVPPPPWVRVVPRGRSAPQ